KRTGRQPRAPAVAGARCPYPRGRPVRVAARRQTPPSRTGRKGGGSAARRGHRRTGAHEIAVPTRSCPQLCAAPAGPANGSARREWMAEVGARVESPVALLREYLTALRALLRGERVRVRGRYVSLDGVALDWPPSAAPPVLAGATGPRSLRLCGEAADGTIL